MATLDKTIVWINKTEGRDKFCKTIQYAARFLMWTTQDSNKELSARFKGLFNGMKNARKLFRLFKSLNEYHKINQMLKKPDDDEFAFYLNILSRLGFLLYWIFDNLQVLGDIKFLNVDPKKNGKSGATCWFFGLLFGLIVYVRELVKISHEQINIEKAIATCKEEEVTTKKNQLKQLQKKKIDCILNILKSLGDMITASQGSEIAPKLLKINFNDGWIGFGGFLSAVITSYQLY